MGKLGMAQVSVKCWVVKNWLQGVDQIRSPCPSAPSRRASGRPASPPWYYARNLGAVLAWTIGVALATALGIAQVLKNSEGMVSCAELSIATDDLAALNRDQLATGQWFPRVVGEWDAGHPDHRGAVRSHRYAGVLIGECIVGRASALPNPEARRFGAAVALQAPIAMREQGIAVGIEEVGRPERAQLGGEFGQN
jgi:hypothetical protein